MLGPGGKKELARCRRVRVPQADENVVWEYKAGKGLDVHPFCFPYYQNQPGQNYVPYLKIKISRKGSHFEFALCFLGKNLAVKLKIMVVGLSNILQSAFLLSPQPSSLKVTSPTSRISSFLWVSGSPEFSQRAAYTSREEETFGCQVASFRSSLGTQLKTALREHPRCSYCTFSS